jgi:hypothetical protein
MGKRWYSSHSFLNLAIDVLTGQRHAPTVPLPQERIPVPFGQEAGWASELAWTPRLEEKCFASAGDRTTVVKSDTILTELSKLPYFN